MKRVLFHAYAPHVVIVGSQDVPEFQREFIKTNNNTCVATGTATAGSGALIIEDSGFDFTPLLPDIATQNAYVYNVATSGAAPYRMEGALVNALGQSVPGPLNPWDQLLINPATPFGVAPANNDTYYLLNTPTPEYIDLMDREWDFNTDKQWWHVIENLTEDRFDYFHNPVNPSVANDHIVFTRPRRLVSITTDIAIEVTFENPLALETRNAPPRPYPNEATGTMAKYLQAASYPKVIGCPAAPTVTNLDLQMLNYNTGVKEMWIMTPGATVSILAY